MGHGRGVLIAIASSALGGIGAAVTRYLVFNADPLTLATLRWGVGTACLLPTALMLQSKMPPRRDLLPIAALGFCFFGVFFVLYNIAVSYTTAARASLALSTAPLLTMMVGALLGKESLTKRKTIGVCVAVSGAIASLATGLSTAPSGAWQGELIMAGAVVYMAFYNVWSRPFIQRSSALGFLAVGMSSGAIGLIILGLATDRIKVLTTFSLPQWLAGMYLGVGGGALAFILWAMALQRTTPTRVATTITVQPVAAASLAAYLLGEPITGQLVAGLLAVFCGIWIATT
jgi:drug/metabolite transporter (DMT)-like permease